MCVFCTYQADPPSGNGHCHGRGPRLGQLQSPGGLAQCFSARMAPSGRPRALLKLKARWVDMHMPLRPDRRGPRRCSAGRSNRGSRSARRVAGPAQPASEGCLVIGSRAGSRYPILTNIPWNFNSPADIGYFHLHAARPIPAAAAAGRGAGVL